jgi:hypothetical protein
MIQGETETDSNQPCPEPRGVAEPGKATVRTQNCFLRDVLSIGRIAQDSARNPERQRAALLEAPFKLAPKGSFFKIERRLGLRRATGPSESLHLFSPYNCQTPPPGFEFDRKPIFMNAGRVRSCWVCESQRLSLESNHVIVPANVGRLKVSSFETNYGRNALAGALQL